MIKHFEKNLTADIIRIIADYAELAVGVDDIEVEFEKVALNEV
jgi:hypothetical protein